MSLKPITYVAAGVGATFAVTAPTIVDACQSVTGDLWNRCGDLPDAAVEFLTVVSSATTVGSPAETVLGIMDGCAGQKYHITILAEEYDNLLGDYSSTQVPLALCPSPPSAKIAMPAPTRFYLRTRKQEYRPLLWVQNNKVNEMLLGLYGQQQKQPVLRAIWPECDVATNALAALRFDWSDAQEVGVTVDHITCHADGRFHVKTRGEKNLYVQAMQRTEPLGPDTEIFLEPIILSDLARHYPPTAKQVKRPHVFVDVHEDQHVPLRGMFSGVNYALEQVMAATMAQFEGAFGGTRLVSGTLKGFLVGRPESTSEDVIEARPRGTILSLKFPVGDDRWRIKSMLFE